MKKELTMDRSENVTNGNASMARPFQTAVGVLLIAFGLGTALASFPAFAEPTRLFIDLMIWPLDGKQSLASPETRLLCAILGGILVGWGVTMWRLASLTSLSEISSSDLVGAMRSGLLAWFVVDSTASVLAGAPVNAAVNAAILAGLLVPLGKMTR
jgi:hypothetical protein